MNRIIAILAVLLAGQLVLAGAMHFGDDAGAAPTTGTLADFDRASVDAITLAGAESDTLRLERGADGWQLAQADGFPLTTTRWTTCRASFRWRNPKQPGRASMWRYRNSSAV